MASRSFSLPAVPEDITTMPNPPELIRTIDNEDLIKVNEALEDIIWQHRKHLNMLRRLEKVYGHKTDADWYEEKYERVRGWWVCGTTELSARIKATKL